MAQSRPEHNEYVVAPVDRPISSVGSRPSNDVPMSASAPGPSSGRGALDFITEPPTSLALVPCERCVRTSKTCRGPSGARCDHCKRLKQKCSNSSGPARGRHSANTAGEGPARSSGPPLIAQKAAPVRHRLDDLHTQAQVLKRKVDDRGDSPAENSDSKDEDYETDGGPELPAKLNKRRRTQMNGSMIASRVLKRVKELEVAVKRLEDAYHAELERVDDIVSALKKDMTNLLDDNLSSH